MTTNISESSNYFLNSQLDPVMNLSPSEYQELRKKYPQTPMSTIDPKMLAILRKELLSKKKKSPNLLRAERTITWIGNHSGSIATAAVLIIAACAYAVFYP